MSETVEPINDDKLNEFLKDAFFRTILPDVESRGYEPLDLFTRLDSLFSFVEINSKPDKTFSNAPLIRISDRMRKVIDNNQARSAPILTEEYYAHILFVAYLYCQFDAFIKYKISINGKENDKHWKHISSSIEAEATAASWDVARHPFSLVPMPNSILAVRASRTKPIEKILQENPKAKVALEELERAEREVSRRAALLRESKKKKGQRGGAKRKPDYDWHDKALWRAFKDRVDELIETWRKALKNGEDASRSLPTKLFKEAKQDRKADRLNHGSTREEHQPLAYALLQAATEKKVIKKDAKIFGFQRLRQYYKGTLTFHRKKKPQQ